MPRGRPRQFDIEEALNSAMLVFWRRGYRGTSLDDLTEALKISRPSLYAAFGDKEALFMQVVDHYRNQMIVPSAIKLLSCENLREGLQTFFRALANLVTGSETPPGCLIACLLSEECCESDTIKAKLATLIETADKNFTRLFQVHRNALSPALTPESAAKLLLSTVHGLSIRARAGAGERTLLEVGEAFMDAVLVP